jgi:nucleoside-diphosphate-sugar epimerase
MRVLITGSEGFLGTNLVKRLNLDFELSRFDKKLSSLMDITITQEIVDFIKQFRPDCIVHLAANANPKLSTEEPILDLSINVIGTLNVLKGAAALPTKPYVVFSSSAYVYGATYKLPITDDCEANPNAPYGISKLAAEFYIKYFADRGSIRYTILRLFNIYGPRQKRGYVVPDLINKIRNTQDNDTIPMRGHPDDARDFIYVDDVTELFLKVIEKRPENKTFNVGSGMPTKIRDLASVISDGLGLRNVKYRYDGLATTPSVFCADSTKVRHELGWQSKVSVKEGITRLICDDAATP